MNGHDLTSAPITGEYRVGQHNRGTPLPDCPELRGQPNDVQRTVLRDVQDGKIASFEFVAILPGARKYCRVEHLESDPSEQQQWKGFRCRVLVIQDPPEPAMSRPLRACRPQNSRPRALQTFAIAASAMLLLVAWPSMRCGDQPPLKVVALVRHNELPKADATGTRDSYVQPQIERGGRDPLGVRPDDSEALAAELHWSGDNQVRPVAEPQRPETTRPPQLSCPVQPNKVREIVPGQVQHLPLIWTHPCGADCE